MSDEPVDKIASDALGFYLEIAIFIGDFESFGAHHCYENIETGLVEAGDPHKIKIRKGLDHSTACMVAAHEAYHLFESIRHLITTDEETKAETFGGLVRRIYDIAIQHPA